MTSSVPTVGNRNGDPTDATRPAGKWVPFEFRQPHPLSDPLVWRPGWDNAVRYQNLSPQDNIVGLLWLDEESGR